MEHFENNHDHNTILTIQETKVKHCTTPSVQNITVSFYNDVHAHWWWALVSQKLRVWRDALADLIGTGFRDKGTQITMPLKRQSSRLYCTPVSCFRGPKCLGAVVVPGCRSHTPRCNNKNNPEWVWKSEPLDSCNRLIFLKNLFFFLCTNLTQFTFCCSLDYNRNLSIFLKVTKRTLRYYTNPSGLLLNNESSNLWENTTNLWNGVQYVTNNILGEINK